MPKTIKLIVELSDKVLYGSKTVASVNGRINEYNCKGELQEKYCVERNSDNSFSLWHWGTETCRLQVGTHKVLYYDGFSTSDRDSVYTFLNYFAPEKNYSVTCRKEELKVYDNNGIIELEA